MVEIIPAILPQSYRAIEGGLEKVHEFVNTIQIDFVDGYFAPNKTWWFNGKDLDILERLLNEEQGLPYWENINYEFDLMINDPLDHIDKIIGLGPSKVIFHIEGLNIESMINYFEKLPSIINDTVKFGIAIGINTNIELLEPLMPYVNTIQCMGIKQVGFQGQPFDDKVFEKIKTIKNLYPNKIISVDGAVSLDNAKSLVNAGVNSLVIGSAIFGNQSQAGIIEEFKHICR